MTDKIESTIKDEKKVYRAFNLTVLQLMFLLGMTGILVTWGLKHFFS